MNGFYLICFFTGLASFLLLWSAWLVVYGWVVAIYAHRAAINAANNMEMMR